MPCDSHMHSNPHHRQLSGVVCLLIYNESPLTMGHTIHHTHTHTQCPPSSCSCRYKTWRQCCGVSIIRLGADPLLKNTYLQLEHHWHARSQTLSSKETALYGTGQFTAVSVHCCRDPDCCREGKELGSQQMQYVTTIQSVVVRAEMHYLQSDWCCMIVNHIGSPKSLTFLKPEVGLVRLPHRLHKHSTCPQVSMVA